MNNLKPEIKQKILDYLSSKPIGASSSEISKNIKHNRITVTKYLEIMMANNLLKCEGVAQAKLWSISSSSNKPSVLIVDDEPNVVDLVSLSLIPGKYNILKAYSGMDAINRVNESIPGMIILDLMMPGMDGYEVCKRLKDSSSTRHIPIMILSAKGELTDKLKGLKIGADDYMTKPFDPMELEARVNAMLRRVNQDIDTHPLSRLPGISGLKNQIMKLMTDGENFYVFKIELSNLGDHRRKLGARKVDDIMLLLSRILSETVKEDPENFIAHTLRDNFVVIAKTPYLAEKINSAYEKIVPYIFSDDSGYDMDLMLDSFSSKEIQAKNMNLSQFLKYLKLE